MNGEDEKKNKRCLYCGNYQGYYVKGSRHFESIKKGYCCKHNKVVENHYGCDGWISCSRKFYTRKKVATRALYDILTDLSALRQILQESQEEEKEL